jgi:hypothetical protein
LQGLMTVTVASLQVLGGEARDWSRARRRCRFTSRSGGAWPGARGSWSRWERRKRAEGEGAWISEMPEYRWEEEEEEEGRWEEDPTSERRQSQQKQERQLRSSSLLNQPKECLE